MQDTTPRRLTRSRDRMLGGVAGGLAEYFDFDPTVMRLLVVLGVLLSGGTVILVYLVMWIVVPEESGASGGGSSSSDSAANAAGVPRAGDHDRTQIIGIVLIAIGGLILLNQVAFFDTLGWRVMRFWWPGLLILGGIALLAARRD